MTGKISTIMEEYAYLCCEENMKIFLEINDWWLRIIDGLWISGCMVRL